VQKIKDKDNEITDHIKQNAKQKEKILVLFKQNEAGLASRRLEKDEAAFKESQSNVASSSYNNLQYLEVLKHAEVVNEKYLRLQNEFS
jgi:hypothetical protein